MTDDTDLELRVRRAVYALQQAHADLRILDIGVTTGWGQIVYVVVEAALTRPGPTDDLDLMLRHAVAEAVTAERSRVTVNWVTLD